MTGIFWLASYPKSGNTWFRAFLSRLLCASKDSIDINSLKTDGTASLRSIFDYILGIEASDLTAEEINALRPKVYAYMAAQAPKPLYIKIHDAYTFLADKQPLIPTSGCNGAIYIIRNPLDTAVSLAYHLGCDVDTAIKHMGDPNYCFSDSTRHLHIKLKQQLLTWSGHVASWTNGPGFPVKVIRYEDMHAKPLETFTMAAAFAGFPAVSEEIQQAIARADFKTLKQQEECTGFREKPANMVAFFREGKIGSYRKVLTPAQISQLVSDHATVMRRFGYLGEHDEILF